MRWHISQHNGIILIYFLFYVFHSAFIGYHFANLVFIISGIHFIPEVIIFPIAFHEKHFSWRKHIAITCLKKHCPNYNKSYFSQCHWKQINRIYQTSVNYCNLKIRYNISKQNGYNL